VPLFCATFGGHRRRQKEQAACRILAHDLHEAGLSITKRDYELMSDHRFTP
jgi:hypothetical protein